MVNDDSDSEIDRAVSSRVADELPSKINDKRLRVSKRYPWVRTSAAEFVSSNPREVAPEKAMDCELVQLCDLLLGASFWSLDGSSESPKMKGRRKLARSVTDVLAETLKVPWLQQVPVHRTFSVSLYPDRFNFAYPAPLRHRERETQRHQLSLF
jgi:hypothetical protein